MPMTTCPFCGKKVPNIYGKHHRSVCRVRRGLDKRESIIRDPENPHQKQLDELMTVGVKQ